MTAKLNQYIPELDSLRALAVIMTLFCHFIPLAGFNFRLDFLNLGVDIFFTLSGFLITSILLKTKQDKNKSLKDKIRIFYIRRSLRLFPLYYAFLFFFIVGTNIFHLKLLFHNDYTIWFLTYTPNFYMYFHSWKDIYPFVHLWSLGVEEQFYLFWPLLVLLLPLRFFLKITIYVIVISLTLAFWYGDCGLTLLPITKLHTLGGGALFAIMLFHKKDNVILYYVIRFRELIFYSSLILLIITLLILPSYPTLFFFKQMFLFITTTFLIINTMYGWSGFPKYFFRSSKMQYIGKISYGIYLLHLPIPFFVAFFMNKLHFNISSPTLLIIVYCTFTLLIASLSYKYFEAYFLNLKNRFS